MTKLNTAVEGLTTQEQHCASIIKLIIHVVTQHLQRGVLADTLGVGGVA